jgi:hypothetical protein
MSAAVRVGIIAVLLLCVAVLGFMNIGRFGTADGTGREMKALVVEYVSAGSGGEYECRLSTVGGYPHRMPDALGSWFGGQVVWQYDWICVSGSEEVVGTAERYSDGNTVLTGKSTLRGDLATDEI